MGLFYFLDKYFDKLDDLNFQIKWRKYFHDNLGRFVLVLIGIWFTLTIVMGIILFELVGPIFGFILMIFFAGYFAYILVFQFLRFIAKHNTRYIQSDIFSEENTINYEDVVETIKK